MMNVMMPQTRAVPQAAGRAGPGWEGFVRFPGGCWMSNLFLLCFVLALLVFSFLKTDNLNIKSSDEGAYTSKNFICTV